MGCNISIGGYLANPPPPPHFDFSQTATSVEVLLEWGGRGRGILAIEHTVKEKEKCSASQIPRINC